MFKCVLPRDKNDLNYEFPNAVFIVESFNFDNRRDSVECRVVGFADEAALNVYQTRIKNAQFHDLERSMIYNKYLSIKVADVNTKQHEITDLETFTAIPYLCEVIEAIIVEKDMVVGSIELPNPMP